MNYTFIYGTAGSAVNAQLIGLCDQVRFRRRLGLREVKRTDLTQLSIREYSGLLGCYMPCRHGITSQKS